MFYPLRRLTIRGAVVAILAVLGIVAIGTIGTIGAIVGHITSDRAESTTFGHDAYIWQRQWTASLDRAVTSSSSRVRAWRVLAAELDGRGQAIESSPHLDVLTRTARPVIPVIRISGRLADWDENDVIRRSRTLVQRWRDAGVNVTGVEIDHDCPTGSLRRYASFLANLRRAHARDITLSITALPTWLDSAQLRDVLQHVDEAVLQVHAVQHPSAGLFDREQARVWARAWSEVSSSGGRDVSFRIALPTYGSRVTWTRAGRIAAIESEAQTFADPAAGRELFATPQDVAAFVESLRDERPSNLTGLVWFRVPTADDERAWSLETWHAVIDAADARRSLSNENDEKNGNNESRGINESSGINAIAEPSATIPGLYDIYLRNRGPVDAMVPDRVTITSSSGACEAADAVAPYAMAIERDRMAIELRRVSPRLLARERRTLIGWIRCPSGEIHVDAGS